MCAPRAPRVRASGRVVLIHAFRNALIPVVTVIALSFGTLFSGALITETMFAQPGMGKMIYDAILGNDFNLALVGLLFATFVTLAEQPRRRPRLWLARSADRPDMSDTTLEPELAAPEAAVSVRRLRWRRFRRHRAGMASLVVLALLVLFCLRAWPLSRALGIDPDAADLLSRFDPPSAQHWLGTDDAGRDELIRLMVGGQISLLVGLLATAAGSLIGLTIGVCSGYFGGRIDALLMRFTDGMIALPLLPLLIVLGAVDLTKLGFSAEFAHSGAAGFWRIVIIIAWSTGLRSPA